MSSNLKWRPFDPLIVIPFSYSYNQFPVIGQGIRFLYPEIIDAWKRFPVQSDSDKRRDFLCNYLSYQHLFSFI